MLGAINDRAMQKGGLQHVKDIGKGWLGQVVDQVERGVRGFTLGIEALDRMLYPKRVPAGSLVVVGARPKMGKTAIMGKIIANDSESYKYLAESIRMHPDQRTLKGMMENAGFQNCDYHNLTGGIVAVHRGFKL